MKLPAFCVLLLLSTAAQAQLYPELTPAAAKFVAEGAAEVLRSCELAAGTCGKQSLRVLEQGQGESNDEPRLWQRLQLPGLDVSVIFPLPRSGRYHVEDLTVSSSAWPVPLGLSVGAPRRRVSELLGKASSEDGHCAVYVHEDIQADATFCFAGERITKVSWSYFID